MSAMRRALPARLGQAGILVALCVVALALVPLHGEAWWPASPSTTRAWLAAALVAAYVAAVATTSLRVRRRADALARASAAGAATPADWLVVHASQTGQAFELATLTADALREGGLAVHLVDIAALDGATLAATRNALFVASTTGEGDPPDAAAGFIGTALAAGAAFPGLRYAVLALGDRSYRNYCAFGHALDGWLRAAGATPMFDLVEVDDGDPAALRHWQHHLGVAAGAPELPDWSPATYSPWVLTGRSELNPGSVGGAVFELALSPPDGETPAWRAGDIIEIGPRQSSSAVDALLAELALDPAAVASPREGAPAPLHDLLARSHLPDVAAVHGLDGQALAATLQPLPHREYSIASVPGEGVVRLLVRRMCRPDGSPGIGSGWLCDHARPHGSIDARIRANPAFHGPGSDAPVVLVGNGTGVAGLRAHLAERIAAGHHRNWLVFGERHADRDFHLSADILDWLTEGGLARLDLAFSRDTKGAGLPSALLADDHARVHPGYVQAALHAEGERLRRWVDEGATILVCGSLQGMAPGVDAALREILGESNVDALLRAGRYRRDVY